MRESMEIYPRTAAERAMKLHEVLLRASAGKIKWWQAAELVGISERQLRRWRKRLEIFCVSVCKGTIQISADADLVVYDPDYRGTISAKMNMMNLDYSGFENWKIEVAQAP